MLTLVTATGARPEAWALCERWMLRQTFAGPVRWVIVDDGPEPQPITFRRAGWELVLIRPAPFWRPGQNTLICSRSRLPSCKRGSMTFHGDSARRSGSAGRIRGHAWCCRHLFNRPAPVAAGGRSPLHGRPCRAFLSLEGWRRESGNHSFAAA